MALPQIKKLDDIRLNVKPMFVNMYHEYVFEGPCRFGSGKQLEKEFDLAIGQELFKSWMGELIDAMPEDCVNLMEPVYLDRDEQFLTTDEQLEILAVDHEKVDLYWVAYGMRPYDIVVEFAQRYGIPMAETQTCCACSITAGAMHGRDLEFYTFETWDDARDYMPILRTRKALREAKCLLAPRHVSTVSPSAPDSLIDPEKATQKFGIRWRYLSAHELLDQVCTYDPLANHTTPGRKGLNLTEEEVADCEKITDELIAGAAEVDMERDMIQRSVEAQFVVHKFLEAYDCNCFTMPCPDVCATCRINEKKVTFCLNHSLNNEQGIPSACEYDLSAIIAKVILQGIGRRPSYMGNCFTSPISTGLFPRLSKELHFQPDAVAATIENLSGIDNVVLISHSVPNRRWTGFDAPIREYAIRPFARSGFGATLRYDFHKDAGQEITMCRLDPKCEKLFVAKGTVLDAAGYNDVNCSMGVFFQVKDSRDFFDKQMIVGNHMPLIYGDYEKEVIEIGKLLGLEILSA